MTTTILLILLAAYAASAQPVADPLDSVLVAYTLTAQQEAQFSRTDGQLSAFWSSWGGRDSIAMVPSRNTYPDRHAFDSEDDAGLVVKAAAGSGGLYLLFSVYDDLFVPEPDSAAWSADRLMWWLDPLSAGEIFTCADCLIGLYSTTLTCNTHGIDLNMQGADSLSDGFVYGMEPSLTCEYLSTWTPQPTWDGADSLFGIAAEPVAIGVGHKAIEWRIAWDQVVASPRSPSLDGRTRLAFTAGYNDIDSVGDTTANLSWLGKDPWAGDAQSINYWGDLLLEDELAAVRGDHRRRPAAASTRPMRVSASIESYDLHGRRVSTPAVPSGLIVGRGGYRLLLVE